MIRPVHLFVSSSPDLHAERDLVGQVTAALPLTIGWLIGHTPTVAEKEQDSGRRAEACDLYVLILSHDYAAPMGIEVRRAIRVGKKPLAYRFRCAYSPSAQDAIRSLDVQWQVFSDPQEFLALFRRDLVRALLQEAPKVGLELGEVEHLMELAREADTAVVTGQADRRDGDAGRSAVILGREVWKGGK